MLTGPLKYKGYDWWWHSFTAVSFTAFFRGRMSGFMEKHLILFRFPTAVLLTPGWQAAFLSRPGILLNIRNGCVTAEK